MFCPISLHTIHIAVIDCELNTACIFVSWKMRIHKLQCFVNQLYSRIYVLGKGAVAEQSPTPHSVFEFLCSVWYKFVIVHTAWMSNAVLESSIHGLKINIVNNICKLKHQNEPKSWGSLKSIISLPLEAELNWKVWKLAGITNRRFWYGYVALTAQLTWKRSFPIKLWKFWWLTCMSCQLYKTEKRKPEKEQR